jgi:hypothetical protein
MQVEFPTESGIHPRDQLTVGFEELAAGPAGMARASEGKLSLMGSAAEGVTL